MKLLAAIPLIFLPLFFPLLTGFMAKSLGRKFWAWFWLGAALPFVADIILLCLPVKKNKKPAVIKPVESDQIFDHLFIDEQQKQKINHEFHLPKSA